MTESPTRATMFTKGVTMVPCPVTAHTLTSPEARAMPVWRYPDSWARRWSPRAAPRRSSRPEMPSAVGLTQHRFMAAPGVDLHRWKPVDCARATDAVALLGGGGISAQPLDDRVQVVCSADHVDVDGLVRHSGDDIVVGAGNSRVGARVRLARPYRSDRALVQRGGAYTVDDDVVALGLRLADSAFRR